MAKDYNNKKIPRVIKEKYGYSQKSHYQHPDLYEESIIGLDSPFAHIIPTNMAILNVILVGNRNSGKSTFIHAFTDIDDENFFDVLVELPIISSSFINTRFLENKSSPMDIPPFIDTDIARGIILFNKEDFDFLLSEYSISEIKMALDTRYVMIQFIEIGGDHLERLISFEKEKGFITEILNQSKGLLSNIHSLVYFMNFNDLVNKNNEQMDNDNFFLFISRIDYLIKNYDNTNQILIVFTHFDKKLTVDLNINIFFKNISKKFD
ncbi:MAG: hypothetical protein ACFFD1_14605, partial [Candidatus Thorarchaeota archaeon]